MFSKEHNLEWTLITHYVPDLGTGARSLSKRLRSEYREGHFNFLYGSFVLRHSN